VAIRPRLVVNSNEAAAAAAAAGLGLTYIVSYQAAAYVEAGTLRRVLIGYAPPPIPIHVVHMPGRFLPRKVRLFIDHVTADLRAAFTSA
jgi:DNA-binding transcriptional LysR family regulator